MGGTHVEAAHGCGWLYHSGVDVDVGEIYFGAGIACVCSCGSYLFASRCAFVKFE